MTLTPLLSSGRSVILIATLTSTLCHGFAPPMLQSGRSSVSVQQYFSELLLFALPDRSNHDEIVARNTARTDVRNFLTQRAIQSFMFLAEECRDPHTGKWIQDFLGSQNMMAYHGSGALDVDRFRTWESSLVDMMEQPKDFVTVSAKRRGRGHGGWSKNNPYLEERWVEFRIDIHPLSLAQRIVAVREQIANEWVTDLTVLKEANDQILDSYFSKVKAARDEQSGGTDMDDPSHVNPATVAFDRVGINILNNHTAFQEAASSPFRRGSFDLLYNVATQESIHRLLRSFQQTGEAKVVSFEWLRDFYVSRVEEFFDGDLNYGCADAFMEQLLLTSPSVIYTDDGKMGLADPLRLAEQLIMIRSDVLDEWKEIMRHVPEDHIEIRKLLLNKQMDPYGKSSGLDSEGFQ
mmetsp:Transcript_17353/g.38390  ORF Transcript_17353/g.38390 Transcript_17353/m.38390 type:complete len:406 (+) Transcript_17353:230-1447(+)